MTHQPRRGRQKWFSPSSLRHLKESEQRVKELERLKKAHETTRAGIVTRQVHKLRCQPCVYRKPIPPGWLTTQQVAERLDISVANVHRLRRHGRLRGKQYYKGRLEELGDWEEARNHHWFFHFSEVEALEENEDYQRTRENGKRSALIGARKK